MVVSFLMNVIFVYPFAIAGLCLAIPLKRKWKIAPIILCSLGLAIAVILDIVNLLSTISRGDYDLALSILSFSFLPVTAELPLVGFILALIFSSKEKKKPAPVIEEKNEGKPVDASPLSRREIERLYEKGVISAQERDVLLSKRKGE